MTAVPPGQKLRTSRSGYVFQPLKGNDGRAAGIVGIPGNAERICFNPSKEMTAVPP